MFLKVLFVEWKLSTIGKKIKAAFQNESSQKKLRKWKLLPASEKVTGNTDIDLPPTSNSSALKIITLISSPFRLDGRFVCFFLFLDLIHLKSPLLFSLFPPEKYSNQSRNAHHAGYNLEQKRKWLTKIFWNKEFRILDFYVIVQRNICQFPCNDKKYIDMLID